MSQYLPVSDEAAGRDLSAALWALASPPETRESGTVTTHYCGVEEDAAGQWYLRLPDDMPLTVSPLVTPEQLDAAVDRIEQQEDRLP